MLPASPEWSKEKMTFKLDAIGNELQVTQQFLSTDYVSDINPGAFGYMHGSTADSSLEVFVYRGIINIKQ